MKRTTTVLLAAATGLVVVGIAVAGLNDNWSQHLNGDMEVPVRDTNAQGQAIFHLSDDGTSIEYRLIASNIENVFQAHIHHGAPGVNGPVVVWLYPSTTPGAGPPGGGRTDGVLASGTITSANFVSDLAGQPMSTLVDWLNTGQAYVNVHTSDGVGLPNTGPGDFPGGEIRGDVN
ncbi:MAG TPA: CHRD domain-containing protein [Gaiellaceae bacterium]|nr:CHRD domain-containing protein [Gaiellaceae bacterium]